MRLRVLLVLASWLVAGRSTAELVRLGTCGPVARAYDPVEVPVARLQRLGRTAIARVGMVSFRRGEAAPIPFQVDERRGRKLALLDGPEPTTDDKPDVLDADDLVVFMACDAGEQATPEAVAGVAAAAGGTTWREVRVDDPLDGTTAYAYVIVADRPPHTERRYVEYEDAHDTVRTPLYRVACVGALPVSLNLALGTPMGANVLDGLRLRAEATALAGLVNVRLDERDGRHRLVAWKAGPVRVVRRSQHEVDLGFGIHISAGVAHTFFYARHVYGPGSLKLPFSPGLVFRDITAFGGVDFRTLRGWHYHAESAPAAGALIDGHMDDGERGLASAGRWFSVERDGGGLLVATTMSDALARVVPLVPTYVDDEARLAPPEYAPGSVPLAGFRGRHLERLEAGRYIFDLRILGIVPYRAGMEADLLRQIGTSLTADLGAASADASAPK